MSTTQFAPAAAAPRKEQILKGLKGIVNQLTGFDTESLDVHANFLEVGIDSLLLIQATQAIQENFAVKLSVVQLLEEIDTLDAVAAHLDAVLPADAPLPDGAPAAPPEAPAPDAPAPAAASPLAEAPAAKPADVADASLPVPAVDAQQPAQQEASALAPPLPPVAPPVAGTFAQTVGNGTKPYAAETAFGASALEQIIAQQVELMAQQLEMLRGGPGAQPAARQPAAADARPARETAAATQQPAQTTASAPAASSAASPAASAPSVESAPASVPAKPVAAGGQKITPELFNPYQPIDKSAAGGLTPHQQRHLDELIRSYTSRTKESKRLTQAYRPYLADSRVSAGYRSLWKEMVYQIIGKRSRGSRIWDVDGNEYVDLTMGFGLHLFGHSPDFIVEAIERQLKEGIHLGPQSLLAGQVARSISELTGVERVNFCNSGTEAVAGALRVARTVTRRNKFALFAGSYHGWADPTLVRTITQDGRTRSTPLAPGVSPLAVEETLVLDWDDPRSLDTLRERGHELAAVLVEPVQSRRPDIQPREFLHALREVTSQTGAALIFDEMVTGFRVQPGGAQAHFGVTADLVIYGKVLGGGLPVGVVAGKAAYMDAFDGGFWDYGDASYPRAEKTLFAGAYFKHPLTMSIAAAVLERLASEGGRAEVEQLNRRTARLVAELNEFFEGERVPIRVANFGSLFRMLAGREFKYIDIFFYHLVQNGVFVWEGRNCFLSLAHTDEDVDFVVAAIKKSLRETRAGGFLPGDPGPSTRGGDGDGGDRARPEAAAAGVSATAPAAKTVAAPAAAASSPERPASVTPAAERHEPARLHTGPETQFSLYYFGDYPSAFSETKYDLILRSAKYADRHGFTALWIPERHFNSFGGFSPNPSVLAAALARETERIHIRAGSCVVPLHNPLRIAEEWSVVDNLSGGRVGISFASGWHSNDFVFAPDAYAERRRVMDEGVEVVRRLWRGEAVGLRDGKGDLINVRIAPLPKQPELPFWLTSASAGTAVKAATLGGGFLTNLQDQTIEELAEKVKLYREALAANGFDPEAGHVTVLLHTFITDDFGRAMQKSRRPFINYLKSSLGLRKNRVKNQGPSIELDKLSEADLEYILGAGFERYLEVGALIGTPETCSSIVERLAASGVNEVGCLIDWGVDDESVMESLSHVNDLRESFLARAAGGGPAGGREVIEAAGGGAGARPAEPYAVPLTEALRELWLATQMGEDSARAYNESFTLRLRGTLDEPALRGALQQLVDRHEALRASFSAEGDCQWIAPTFTVELPALDFSGEGEPEAAAAEWIEGEISRPFDLVRGPLIRFRLLKLKEDEHLLLVVNHHLIADGRSWGPLMRDFRELYAAAREHRRAELPPPVPFSEHVERQMQAQEGPEMDAAEAYWLKQFADGVPTLDLPTDRPRPALPTYNGDDLHLRLDAPLTAALRQLSVRQGSTLLMFMLTAYGALLHRLSGQDDIVVGTPAVEQASEGGKDVVGYCLNLLPLRSRVEDGTTFAGYLKAMKRLVLGGYEYQRYSFRRVLDGLNRGRLPLFAATFDFERGGGSVQFSDLAVEVQPNPKPMARFDLHLNVLELRDEILLRWTYNTDLFDAQTVRRWAEHFETMLRAVVADPGRRLRALRLLGDEQRAELLARGNQARAGFRADVCLHELFSEQASRTPEAVAVTGGRERVTYAELDARSERLARLLRRRGVGPESVVGVTMERSAGLVVALLGVLKAGGAYLPLDPEYPAERLKAMIDGAGARVVVAGRGLGQLVAGSGAEVLEGWDEDGEEAGDDAQSAPVVRPDNLAYVIYTSGSTGRPKGVCVTHANVARLFSATEHWFDFNSEDVWTLFHSYAFDFSVWELWGALLHGGRLVIVSGEVARSPADFLALLAEERVTVLNQTPSAFRQLMQADAEQPELGERLALRFVIFGGEALEPSRLAPWYERHADTSPRLVNMYGITETTVHVTYRPLTSEDSGAASVIGGPIPDLELYLLDSQMEPVPLGVTGEMYVGGEGLARGYLGRPGLTAERFIPNPFSLTPGARLYKSGDVARYTAAGELEYLGRNDRQVKVRGYRIEVGEVEAQLSAHPRVREVAVAVVPEAGGERRLAAYVVPAELPPPTAGELRAFLKDRLPEYMIPTAWVTLESLPLTINGKVDRKSLPAPDETARALAADFVAPRDEVEEKIAAIWSDVLGVEAVGVNDGFLDLGGHSLLAMQLVGRLRQAFGLKVGIRELFESATVANLAAAVARGEGAGAADEGGPARFGEEADALMPESTEGLSDQEVEDLLGRMLDGEGSINEHHA
ncbi:MAG TPA: MupA/Atu3671 family FMN-dependent luciferase-like monooxygenase [Pyrinomonadaceae bacterium]|jgi:natural product biosynthesis luciferase-like monooxygenase protein/amino acid adenylation domain-containing protein